MKGLYSLDIQQFQDISEVMIQITDTLIENILLKNKFLSPPSPVS